MLVDTMWLNVARSWQPFTIVYFMSNLVLSIFLLVNPTILPSDVVTAWDFCIICMIEYIYPLFVSSELDDLFICKKRESIILV